MALFPAQHLHPHCLLHLLPTQPLRNPRTLPSPQTYPSILERCAAENTASQGQQLHAHLIKSNLLSNDNFLTTKLLFMYSKCGHLSSAERLFDEMPHRTIFAWNALISAYAATRRNPFKAIQLYREMRLLGVEPDACTLATVLKACGAEEDHYCGSEIHGLAVKRGLVSATFVVNALVTMYAKCGRHVAARRLFEWMPEKKDVVSWNSVIAACLQAREFVEVVGLFREMLEAGIGTNSYTTVAILQACAELQLLKLGKEIHGMVLKCQWKFELYEANAMISMYARCEQISQAVRLFHEMHEKDNVSWNSMLSGYVQNGMHEDVVGFFREMCVSGFEPDLVSVISVASALGRLRNLSGSKEIHAYAVKNGFDSNLQVGNTLMDMYTKCCCVIYAERVFRKMPHKDFVSWTTVIAGYAQTTRYLEAMQMFREVQEVGMKVDSMMIGSVLLACSGLACISPLKQVHGYAIRHGLLDIVLENTIVDVYGDCGKVDHALRLFRGIQNKDLVSWTSMLSCYVHNGLLNEALRLFSDMKEASIELDAVALVTVLAATAGLSSLSKGKEIHGFLTRRCFHLDGSVSNALVDMYSRCGSMDNAMKVFRMVKSKDLVLWTTMINASGMHGLGKEAIDLFRRMQEMRIVPDHVTFLALLYACSHSRKVDEGKLYLEKMIDEYGLKPWPEHYACIVDLLGRSGRMDEAYEFIKSMPIEPTTAVWCALLGACHVHGNNKWRNVAAEKLLELEPENPGNYVLVSNVFASMGKWKDVDVVRARMKERGLMKDPACSWIEVGNKVHAFVARDSSHEDSVAIYAKLAEITQRLEREGGYVADTRFVLHDTREEEKIKMLYGHSERLAITFGLIHTRKGTSIRITKNLRVCSDCHEFTKLVSKIFEREIIVRDGNRFHHFKDGTCSCGEFW